MKNIEIVETEAVSDIEALIVQAATFEGSAPFSGTFAIWDIEEMTRTDPKTGNLIASVSCAFGDRPFTEESLIEIEVIALEARVIGFEGEVIRHMRLAS